MTGPQDWFRGALIVARRDLIANAKSVRVLVISVVMLLVMLGAAYGISGGFGPTGPGLQYEYVMWSHAAYPSADVSEAGIVVWVSDAFGAPRAGVDVDLGEPPVLGDNVFRVRDTRTTNASGWVSFPALGPDFWPLQIQVGIATFSTGASIEPTVPTSNWTVVTNAYDLLGDFSFRDVALQVVTRAGTPGSGATVANDTAMLGPTDANGHFATRLDPGLHFLNVTYAGETFPVSYLVREPQPTNPFGTGPDSVLLVLAFLLMGLFGPIVAIVVAYDALAKERMQGSLELLLVRPASRAGLALGKFLGTFASVALPILGVELAGFAVIAGLTGAWPDATFGAAFVVTTLGLLTIYVLIMQVLSTFVKSPGTAVLSAVMVWLVFNVIWQVVFLLVTSAVGIPPGTRAYFDLSAILLLFNPTGVYQLTLGLAIPASLVGSFGVGDLGSLPDWVPPVAFVLWIVVLLLLSIYLFRRRLV